MASRTRFSRNRAALEYSQKVLTQQELLMPHLPDGKIDWNTLGNMLTAKIVGEVLCASYIDKKHRMARPSFAVDTDWQYAYEERDVVVLRKEFSDSPFHCWMGRAIIECPLKEIANFLEDPASAKIYDKHITESKHLQVLSESESHKDIIAYYFTETRECLVSAKRDFLFYLRHTHTDDKYVLTALSVDHPQCPPVEGVPRAQLQAGSGWHLERHMGSNARTLVTYIVHTDLIALPPIIANRVLRRQPMNVLHLKNHLMILRQQLPPCPLPHTGETTGHEHQGTTTSGGRGHGEEPLSISRRGDDKRREGRETQSQRVSGGGTHCTQTAEITSEGSVRSTANDHRTQHHSPHCN